VRYLGKLQAYQKGIWHLAEWNAP